MKCPTEIAITDRREAELAKNGFMPLVHRKNSDFAAFIGAQSLQKPAEYDDPDATANANLAARLPYLFACLPLRALPEVHRARQDRLVQGARRHAALAERTGSCNYVDGDPAQLVARTTKAQQAAGRRRGRWSRRSRATRATTPSKFFLRPHYQLEGLTVSLRLVSKLPSQKAA